MGKLAGHKAEQHRKFEKAARELGADVPEEQFDEALRRVTRAHSNGLKIDKSNRIVRNSTVAIRRRVAPQTSLSADRMFGI